MASSQVSGPVVQLRVVLRGVSPLVWRRLLVPDGLSLGGLAEVLQVAFGWSDRSAHGFVVHARKFRSPSWLEWSPTERLDSLVGELGLRRGDRFVYDHGQLDAWVVDVRVEAVFVDDATCRCVAGRRKAPPQACGGPGRFMANRVSTVWEALQTSDRIIREVILDAPPDRVFTAEERCDLVESLTLVTSGRLDRRGMNGRLATVGVAR